ncbi:MAG TPA: M48 family metalloprotease [Candidatus Binatia bacterium]|nr:M48 family metalloprotease [Candidatus Binatia bacterium]
MYSQIASNKRRTVIIMAVFLLFIAALAYGFAAYLGNPNDAYVIIAIGVIYAFISYFIGSRGALAVNGAREIQKNDNPRLWRIIENLSITDGLPMPKVFIIDDPAPNAFATGRKPDKAAVCATTGLLDIMTDTELEGVFAHELGHVKNYDIRVSMITFALVAVVALIADILLRLSIFGSFSGGRGRNNNNEGQAGQLMFILAIVAAIVAPILATLIQLAISRQREYLADATGALTTRYPEGLESALKKIERTGSALKKQNTATAHFFFANPLKGHTLLNLFSTHPPIPDRINRLEKMDMPD